jgi:multiple sugar transport system permease protein
MAAAGIAAVSLFIVILCWNEYLLAAYLATHKATTLPPWIVGQMSIKEAQVGGGAEELAQFSVATVLAVLPVMLFAGVVQHALSRSMILRK